MSTGEAAVHAIPASAPAIAPVVQSAAPMGPIVQSSVVAVLAAAMTLVVATLAAAQR